MQLGEYIKAKREAKGLSLRELGTMSKIDFAHLGRIEKGWASPPGEELLARLAEALDEDLDILMAMTGRVTLKVQGIIARHPKAFIQLIKELENSSERVIGAVSLGVRDGRW